MTISVKVQDPLTLAQAHVTASLLREERGRKWLKAQSVDSYGDPSNGVEFYVLQGSPPRGFVIAWRTFPGTGYGRAVALDGRGNRLKEFGSIIAVDDEGREVR